MNAPADYPRVSVGTRRGLVSTVVVRKEGWMVICDTEVRFLVPESRSSQCAFEVDLL
jgi:hypothetical protein